MTTTRAHAQCRECKQDIGDAPYLCFGTKNIKGPSRIHVSCIIGNGMDNEAQTELLGWVRNYIQATKDPMTLARERIRELEATIARQKTVLDDYQRRDTGSKYKS